jgi:hypothetical protein
VKLLLVESLRKNLSIKKFWLFYQGENDSRSFRFNRTEYLRILCDRSSINETYTSNHTLQTGCVFHYENIESQHVPCANKESNKHQVAREKIIQYHTFESVNFVPSSLPMQWVANATSNDHLKLAQMYSIVGKVPHVFQNKQRKRKADTL